MRGDGEPYHRRIPPLRVAFVAYPAQVEYLLPPAGAILALPAPPSDADFRDAVLRIAQGLAARP